MAVEIRRFDYATPLHLQKFGTNFAHKWGRSVGIVRSRTEATEFSFLKYYQETLRRVLLSAV
jgi:hypothetical protein